MDKELIERLAREAGGRFELLGAGDETTRSGLCFEGDDDEATRRCCALLHWSAPTSRPANLNTHCAI